MNRSKRKLNAGTVILFVFLLTPFFSIAGIKNTMSTGMYQIWQIMSIYFLMLMVLIRLKQINLDWGVSLFGVYQIVILGSSVYNNGISMGIIAVIVASILVFMLIQTSFYYEIVYAVSIVVIISVLINFPVMIQNRGNINAVYFIGGKNALGIFLIPGIFFLIISSLEKNNQVNKVTIFAVLSSLLTIFIGSSGTGIVVAFCTMLFLLLSVWLKPQKTICLVVVFTVYALFLLFSEKFFLTKYWLEFTDSLGKDSTLTARTTIWGIAKGLISDSWLFGAGRGVELSHITTWGERQTIYEAHNFILEILMEGGIVALLLFGLLFFKTVCHLNMEITKHKVAFVGLCMLLINGLTESTVNVFLVMMLLSVACRYANEQEDGA